MRVAAIFWDNDGVLVETEHLYFEATRRVLASVGVDLTEEHYRELFLTQGKGAWHLAEQRGVAAVRIQQLKEERNIVYGELIQEAPRLLAGVADTLAALHGRYVMGIVTSSRRDHFELIHRETGLLRYFDFVITADDCPRTKPCPDPYVMAIGRSGVEPGACVAIEDSERGLEAATQAGIRCVIVPSGLTLQQNFKGAAAVLSSVRDIPHFLRSSTPNPQILKS
jgi:HAD superfamily hydrolase (TIGR01509 family)